MTDLEITKLCAEAMGWNSPGSPIAVRNNEVFFCPGSSVEFRFEPLHNDAQAMALVRRCSLALWGSDIAAGEWKWHAEQQFFGDDAKPIIGHGNTPNRAICECVANMQISKCSKPKT